MTEQRIQCEQCGKSLKVPSGSAGKKAKCSTCNHIIVIPGGDAIPTNRPRKSFPSRTLTISAVWVLILIISSVIFYYRPKDIITQQENSQSTTNSKSVVATQHNPEQVKKPIDQTTSPAEQEAEAEEKQPEGPLIARAFRLGMSEQEAIDAEKEYSGASPTSRAEGAGGESGLDGATAIYWGVEFLSREWRVATAFDDGKLASVIIGNPYRITNNLDTNEGGILINDVAIILDSLFEKYGKNEWGGEVDGYMASVWFETPDRPWNIKLSYGQTYDGGKTKWIEVLYSEPGYFKKVMDTKREEEDKDLKGL